jgi:hypothetical protein
LLTQTILLLHSYRHSGEEKALGTRAFLKILKRFYMPKKKISDRESLLAHLVGVRLNTALFTKLKKIQKESYSQSIGEVIRNILLNKKITCYYKDRTMDEPARELIKIKNEINAIGVNINQITNFFYTADVSTQKVFFALKVAEQYSLVKEKIEGLKKLLIEMHNKWSAK